MARPRSTALWALVILGLLALRIPAWAAPIGSDQSLYLYISDRLLEGGVPYVDAWDQKPPAVFVVYALFRAVWPSASVVALADIVAAVSLAWALVALGRQTIGPQAGWAAASVALLFGNPAFSRLSGVYVRGQCEVFIAPAVTCALVLLTRVDRRNRHLILAGMCLALAFWLKYNALAYALPIGLAVWLWGSSPRRVADARVVVLGFMIPTVAVLTYFAVQGALGELWLATIVYNLRYSGETYSAGLTGAIAHLAALPFEHARGDFLWFLGGLGAACLVAQGAFGERRVAILAMSWLTAAIVSIAINGARDLPQYFIQAVPAMAFSAASGLVVLARRHVAWAVGLAAVLLIGLWKVGTEAPAFGGFRWAGLPQLVENVRFDSDRLLGRIDTRTYLARFKGVQKYDALATHDLTEYVRQTTAPSDSILVFGFSPGVYVESQRMSSSRFFWSRPVVLEFASGRPGFGSAGLLRDLESRPPALVALQKKDWTDDEQSEDFFLRTPSLRAWLFAGYTLASDTPAFSVWRRN
jgi:hypothetical protein